MIQLAAGYEAEDPRLDRLPSQNDNRLSLFPVERLLEPTQGMVPRRRNWRRGPLLDQGQRGACVGFSGTNFLRASPIRNRDIGQVKDVRDSYALGLYEECQRVDEWDSTPPEEGTSVDALGRVLKSRGLVSTYYWVTGSAEELAAVLSLQPAIMGTWWWSGMSAADQEPHGIALPTGRRLGGHAWLVDGYLPKATFGSTTDAWFRGYQSWGPWGVNNRGTFWVPRQAMETLLGDQGEAMVPSELSL